MSENDLLKKLRDADCVGQRCFYLGANGRLLYLVEKECNFTSAQISADFICSTHPAYKTELIENRRLFHATSK